MFDCGCKGTKNNWRVQEIGRKKIQAKDKYRQKEYKLKKRGWGKRYKSLTGSNKINTSQWGIACIYFVVWVYELYKKDTSQVLACTYFYSEVCVYVKKIQAKESSIKDTSYYPRVIKKYKPMGIACIYFVVWVYELYKKDTSQVLACTYFYSEVCVFVKMI